MKVRDDSLRNVPIGGQCLPGIAIFYDLYCIMNNGGLPVPA